MFFRKSWLILVISTFINTAVYPAKVNNSTIHQLRTSIILGQVGLQVTTKNEDAREHFLLGAAFLHAFMYDLAIQQFQQAQKLDPGFAMSYWGEAMAYKHPIWNVENRSAAQEVLARYARQRDQRHLTAKETLYLKAVTLLFSQQPLQQRDQSYRLAMKQFYQRFPNDPDIGAFYALAMLGVASDFPNEKSSPMLVMAGRKLIRQLFKKFPNHPGVVHYYLHYHDTEDLALAKEALPAAKIVLKLMSSSSHVTHMAAHIYRRLGMWDDYIAADEISIEAADNLCKKLYTPALYSCNAENKYHSIEWLHDGYLKKKQFDKANKLVMKMADIVTIDPALMYKQWYYRMWARQVLYSRNWTMPAIIIQPIAQQNDDLYWSVYSECGAIQASGFLALHQGKSPKAQLQRLKTLIQYAHTLTDPFIEQTCQIAKVQIEAEKERFAGNKSAAARHLKKALELENNRISTELTPSLSFLDTQQFYQEYFLTWKKQ